MDLNEQKTGKTTKVIPNDAASFEANGNLYLVETTLSIERYAEFQILEKELGYGVSFKVLFEKIKKVYDNLNKGKFADSAVAINNILTGISKLEERTPVVLKICALFINRADEDRTKFNQDVINNKINDWREEGLDMMYFFTLAGNSVSGFLEIYNKITQSISLPVEALRIVREEE